MLILTEKNIMENYKMEDAIGDIKQGLLSKKAGTIDNPHRTVLAFPKKDGSSLYMPSADLKKEMSAVKVVSIFPQNPTIGEPTTQGVLVLTDGNTGEHLCLMDASYLTRLRTGALSAIATDKLARPDAEVLAVIGTGAMAFEQVLGIVSVRKIKKMILFNRTPEQAELFREKLITFGIEANIAIVLNCDAAVKDADIINCATRSSTPVFDGHSLKSGAHINGVGSFLPSMREVDQTTIERANKIVVDDLAGVKDEAGELIYADKHSDWKFSDIYGELSDIVSETSVRKSDEEITFFKSVGSAYFDLAAAIGVYEKLQGKGIGVEVDL